MKSATTNDKARSIALAAATASFALIPTLGPLITGKGNGDNKNDTVLTPPGYAFSIWFPIFVGCTANTVQHILPDHASSAVNRRSGWALTGAYASNALWSALTQKGRDTIAPVMIPIAAGFAAIAYSRMQNVTSTGAERIAPASTGFLLGWTSLAALIDISVVAKKAGADQTSGVTIAASTAAAVALSTAISTTILRSKHGFVPLGAATVWGLGTIALVRTHPAVARIGAALGASLVAASTIVRSKHNHHPKNAIGA